MLPPFRPLLLLPIAAALANPSRAGTVYVRAGAIGANNGSSWADAFSDLRPALDQAQTGDELWVAAGTYVPGPTAAPVDTFQLRSGVALYGGFAGSETSRAQRDWALHPTLLSGDIGHDDVPGNLNSANSAHVVTGSGTDATAVIDGFTITKGAYGLPGTPAGSYDLVGSGLFNVSGSPTVTNCTFLENYGAFNHGAAVLNVSSSPTITRCAFIGNYVHMGNGAAIYNAGGSAPTIRDCEFRNNVSVLASYGQGGQGGAIATEHMPPPLTIERCVFVGNEARQFYPAGGGDVTRGGAVSFFGDGLTLKECSFSDNRANAGGAVFLWGAASIVNCVFWRNEARPAPDPYDVYGAALFVGSGAGDVVNVVNCTFSANRGKKSAVYCSGALPTRVRNCILWGNTSTDPTYPPLWAQIKGSSSIQYSCVQALFLPIPGEDPPDPANFPGCTELNPLLANASAGDLHLSGGSPGIDAGNNAEVPAGAPTDLDGNQRIVRGLAGAGQAVVDLGAYEYGSAPPAVPFCFGDGTGTACPCANNSAVGSGAGCLNSLGVGGKLAASGVARLAADSLVLTGTDMPNASALYFQGTAQGNGGSGTPFGDGLRCASGAIVRLGTKLNAAGASSYPASGDLPVSIRGACSAGSTYSYQAWYRNADPLFCTSAAFNLTNGVAVTWAP